jgi:hypothetical protein
MVGHVAGMGYKKNTYNALDKKPGVKRVAG